MKKATINSILKKSKGSAGSKFNKNRSYSSFWMDDAWDRKSMYSGLGSARNGGGDTVKAIKLASYHRAIANFTKILTKKDLTVVFQGNDSFTDGKTISLSSTVGEKNFDVHVGLALHEASHCILTDFKVMPILNSEWYGARKVISWELMRSLINWIEDRRIDHYVFSTSPGYKAYYHKLYDHYWNADVISKALKSPKYRTVTEDSYELHIVNMLNPAFNADALPGLREIVKLIDVRNIARIKTTTEAAEIAEEVAKIIGREIAKAATTQPQPQPSQGGNGEDEKKEGKPQSSQGEQGEDNPEDQPDNDSTQPGNKGDDGEQSGGDQPQGTGEDDGEDTGEGGSESGEGGQETLQDMTAKEEAETNNAIAAQRSFLQGNISDRKDASKSLQKRLDAVAETGVELQAVDNGKFDCLVYDFTKKGAMFTAMLAGKAAYDSWNYRKSAESAAMYNASTIHWRDERDRLQKAQTMPDDLNHYFSATHDSYSKAVDKGLEFGALLGRKLQVRNESRDLTHNRLLNGKLDGKRIAHAGYGIESVFKQIYVDKFKKANLHISLDASGSMGGDKWESTIQMTMAIAKAATYCGNLNIQVSLRHTAGMGKTLPVIINVYDSSKNPLRQLELALRAGSTPSMTPEGLCFEAMHKKGMLIKSTKDMDSYFLNISDGAPGGCGNYSGPTSWEHTRRQVSKMEQEMNIQIISFFVESGSYSKGKVSESFSTMYGRNNSFIVNPNDMLSIAKALNTKFLSAKVTA